MTYIVHMIGGERIPVTDAEGLNIIKAGRVGKIAIPSIHGAIDLATYATCLPEAIADVVEDRRAQQTGILHDGTRVRRHFGQWVDALIEVPDDKGAYKPVKLDPAYYPEVAADCVPTEKEYLAIAHLSREEKLQIIMQHATAPRQIGKPEEMKKLLEKK